MCLNVTFTSFVTSKLGHRFKNYLERIADGEVEGVGILETTDVEVTRLTSIVRHVKTDTPVETDNQEVKVVTNTDACAKSQFTEEVLEPELS